MLCAALSVALAAAWSPGPTLQEPDWDTKAAEAQTQAGEEIEDALALARALDLDQVNAALAFLAGDGHGLQLLRDVDFELMAVSNEAGDSTLGFSYDYHKSSRRWVRTGVAKEWGLELEFRTSGNVAFEPDFNPEDLLETKLSLSWFRNDGGVNERSTEELQARMNELEDLAVEVTDPDELATSPAMRELDDLLEGFLSNQLYLDLGIDAGLESNQAFSQKNLTYGAHLGVLYTPWRKDSLGASLNLLDYPFAVLRLATGYDDEFRVIGATFPSLLLSLDRVRPSGGDPRDEAGDDSDYTRLRTEIAMRTPIAHVGLPGLGDEEAGDEVGDVGPTVYFDATWRAYDELDASDAIEAADLDRYDYFEVALRSSTGIFVSYTHGRLPFDREDGRSFQAGFQLGL